MTNDVSGHGERLPRVAVILLLALTPLGCREYADHTPRRPPPTTKYPAAVADPLPAGRVRGRVAWEGDRPVVPPVAGLIDTPDGPKWGEVSNPFAPRIADDGGMAGVVLWLTPVDAKQVKPWPYSTLVVEHADGKLRSKQPGVPDRVGFVKVGDEVELVTRGKPFGLLRGRGAGFFTLTFPEPDRPRRRTLDTPGVVEVTSAAGDFWSTADVVVCEHPYYAATDAAGRFELESVPPGEYQLTARVRNWAITGRDRDPETGKTVRLTFAEPGTVTQKVVIPTAGPVEVVVSAGRIQSGQ
jgi:hypothetical protein